MWRDRYEAAWEELVQSATVICATVSKEDGISLGRTSKWPKWEVSVGGRGSREDSGQRGYMRERFALRGCVRYE